MRLAWITDPHLNHCDLADWDRLVSLVRDGGYSAVLISGDISEGDDVVFQLRRMADVFDLPIHFVLGNHDFYQSSIATARAAVIEASRSHPRLDYLTDSAPLTIADSVALIGEDGWGDATVGDFENSPLRLQDFLLIDDFQAAPTADWKSILIRLGLESSERLKEKLEAALANHDRVLVATHVPPFRQACWYQGRTTDDFWAPFFVCGQVGEVLKRAAEQHPQKRIEVLCGHTHSPGVAWITANLTVTTAGAQYGCPGIAATIVIGPTEIELLGFNRRP